MSIGPITVGTGSMYAAVNMIKRAEVLLNESVADVASGDIVDAALKIQLAKTQAGMGAGIARASDEVSGYILDILA